MHKLYDSNYGYLTTYPCNNNVNFTIKNNILKCCSTYNKSFIFTNPSFIYMINKKDIYNDAYKLGIVISKEIKNLEYIGYKNGCESLFKITNEDITKSTIIVDSITEFTKKYGMPENDNDTRIHYDYQTTNDNDPYNGIMDDDIRHKIINRNIVTIPTKHTKNYSELAKTSGENTIKINRIKKVTNTVTHFDVLPFINVCLMIYYIKRLSYGLKKREKSTIRNLSKIFTYLEDKLEIDNDKDVKSKVLKYLNKLQSETNIYINKNFKYTNFERHIYPDLDYFEDDYYIEKAFRITKYIIVVPILAAYDYLEQSLPYSKNEIHCNECGALLLIKEPLCYDCRLNEYEKIITEYKRSTVKKKQQKAEELEKERLKYIDSCKSFPFHASEYLDIDYIYNRRNIQSKYDNKNKGDN